MRLEPCRHDSTNLASANQRWRRAARCGFAGVLILTLRMGAAAHPATPPQQLVRDVIYNELRAEDDNHNLWSYRELTKEEDGRKLLLAYYETRQGTIHRLLAVDGHHLNAQECQAEDQRIQTLVRSPQALHQAQRAESADSRQERKILRLFPIAFLYREKDRSGDFVTLEFSPNPNFQPSGMMDHALQYLQGTMVVDEKEKRLVSIAGRLMTQVYFWGGLLGHLDKGGTFAVHFQKVAPGDWELQSLDVDMKGKALFFKNIGVSEHEVYTDYTLVPPNTTLAEAAQALTKEDECTLRKGKETARSHFSAPAAGSAKIRPALARNQSQPTAACLLAPVW